MKFPAWQFYPGDWKKDPGVQALDYFTRGIWFEILLLMFESEERGKLILNGTSMPEDALAQSLGLDKQILTTALTKILQYGCASKDPSTGVIYCRRMVKDENLREIRKKSGKQGGNPVLLNQKSNTGDNQKPTPSVSSSVSVSSSSSTPPTPSTNGNHSLILFESVRDTLSDLYKRPRTDPLSYLVQNSLAELCRRPNVNAELDLVVKYRNKIPEKDRQFFPQSFSRLIESWPDVVDRARTFKEPKAF